MVIHPHSLSNYVYDATTKWKETDRKQKSHHDQPRYLMTIIIKTHLPLLLNTRGYEIAEKSRIPDILSCTIESITANLEDLINEPRCRFLKKFKRKFLKVSSLTEKRTQIGLHDLSHVNSLPFLLIKR